MRRETKPGEVMEVDFGHLGLTWDTATRSRRRTWMFSGRLRHSRRAYREVVFNQKQQTFFACHIHAFEYFCGVSEKVTPDNLKAAIIVASFEDPLVNRAYRVAEHYGFLISPCLPRRPEHKGGVESMSSTSSAAAVARGAETARSRRALRRRVDRGARARRQLRAAPDPEGGPHAARAVRDRGSGSVAAAAAAALGSGDVQGAERGATGGCSSRKPSTPSRTG